MCAVTTHTPARSSTPRGDSWGSRASVIAARVASETARPGVRETKNPTASAASFPQQVAALTPVTPMPVKPAAPRTSWMRSGSESEAIAVATACSVV